MKKIVLLSLAILAMACSKDEVEDEQNTSNNAINGSWKLTHALYDPGDGSGTFMSVNSNKKLTFTGSGSVTTNGNICEMEGNTSTSTSGTYSISDSTIVSNDCGVIQKVLYFKINGDTLDVYYPCIEPCIARYAKD